MFNVPILMIVFKRLEATKRVFETIKQLQPKKLYISADGARFEVNGEKEKCEEVREYILSSIDWDCEVKTLFQKENLGCGIAPSSAMNWLFENEEMGIILEDDTVPNMDFFRFCKEMLIKYKEDERFGMIGGHNAIDKENCSDTYYFSKYVQTWGWATWRRAWNGYDYGISLWNKLKNTNFIYSIFPEKYIADNYKHIFDQMLDCPKDIWDYQWLFHNLVNDRKTIMPCCNLVSNIGFSSDATHTFDENSPVSNLPHGKLSFPLKHPISFIADNAKDRAFLDLQITKPKQKSIFYRAIRKCYRIAKKIAGVK